MKKVIAIILIFGLSYISFAEDNNLSLSLNKITEPSLKTNYNNEISDFMFPYTNSYFDFNPNDNNKNIPDLKITKYADYEDRSFFDVGLPVLGGILTIAGLVLWGVGFSQMSDGGDSGVLSVGLGTGCIAIGLTVIIVPLAF